METRLVGSGQEPPSTPATAVAPSAPLPKSRRPRVREVSSRYMSPVSSYSSSPSSSAGDLHSFTSSSPVTKYPHQHHRSVSVQRQRRQLKLSEGDENRQTETARSLDSPFPLHSYHGTKTSKQQSQKPLKENGLRLDTPTPIAVPSSRLRASQQRSLTACAAVKMLQSCGISISSQNSMDKNSDVLEGSANPNNLRPFSNATASPLCRSLSSPMSSCEDASIFRSMKNGSLPPIPPAAKTNADTKKPKKGAGHQDDVHSFKLLLNRYMQWRYANAKAEARMHAQATQAERMLYSHGLRMSELYDSVQRKRVELARLRRLKALLGITVAQIPYLEEWSAMEAEYSTLLCEAIQALLHTSQRIPLNGNIRVNAGELGEALASAAKIMETIMLHIGSFTAQAEELEVLISELAKVTNGERVLTEECGDLLSKMHDSQIEESSLRAQIIQHHKSCVNKLQDK